MHPSKSGQRKESDIPQQESMDSEKIFGDTPPASPHREVNMIPLKIDEEKIILKFSSSSSSLLNISRGKMGNTHQMTWTCFLVFRFPSSAN